MIQIFMLVALYLAVISGPLIGGAIAGCKATKQWVGQRRTTTSHAAIVVAPLGGDFAPW